MTRATGRGRRKSALSIDHRTLHFDWVNISSGVKPWLLLTDSWLVGFVGGTILWQGLNNGQLKFGGIIWQNYPSYKPLSGDGFLYALLDPNTPIGSYLPYGTLNKPPYYFVNGNPLFDLEREQLGTRPLCVRLSSLPLHF